MRGTNIGGFPEPERDIRGAHEALRELRRKPRCAESSVARKTGCAEDRLRGRPVLARVYCGRRLDSLI